MATLIIYFSQGGTTEIVAKVLAKNLKADLARIYDLKNRDGLKNRLFASINALREVKLFCSPLKYVLECIIYILGFDII